MASVIFIGSTLRDSDEPTKEEDGERWSMDVFF